MGKTTRSNWGLAAVWAGQEGTQKTHGRWPLILPLTCALIFGIISDSFASNSGYWKFVSVSQDRWIVPYNNHACGSGIGGLVWWEQPTFCTAITYVENRKIEATQGYVCVPPLCEQVEVAGVTGAGACTIQGKPLVSKNAKEPCQYYSSYGGADFGEVTIRKIIKIYEWVCDSGDCFPSLEDNPDPGKPDCNNQGL
ncbi:MAG: hypothetical protein ACD_74C00265G0002 [uncultured bacterium]|nr:MAG: hypothetical protein ACD_74C00265G0002 [uncultured bacterium]